MTAKYRIKRYSENDSSAVPLTAASIGALGIGAQEIARNKYNKATKEEVAKAVEEANKAIKASNKLKEAHNAKNSVKVSLEKELQIGKDIEHGFFGTSYHGKNAKNVKKHINSLSRIKKLKQAKNAASLVALAGLGTAAAHQYFKNQDKDY